MEQPQLIAHKGEERDEQKNNHNFFLRIAVMILALFFATGNVLTGHEPTNSVLLGAPDSPILEVIAGKSVANTNEAKNQVGYDVKSPTYLPAGYLVQIINADAKIKVATILVSPKEVSSHTTLREFFNQQKGILIFMERNSEGFDVQTWFSGWVRDHSAITISINGITGAVHAIVTGKGFSGETTESPAELVFVKNNVLYEIRGITSIDELQQIAQTL